MRPAPMRDDVPGSYVAFQQLRTIVSVFWQLVLAATLYLASHRPLVLNLPSQDGSLPTGSLRLFPPKCEHKIIVAGRVLIATS